MKKNYILAVILLIVSLILGYFIIQKREKYTTNSFQEVNIKEELIRKLIDTRLSQFKLKQIVNNTLGKNNFNYKIYLNDIIETLKSPNLNRFRNEFLMDVVSNLNKKDSEGIDIFNNQNLSNFLRMIREEEAILQQIEEEELAWEQAVNIVPQPFLPPANQVIGWVVPQPQEDEVFDPLPDDAFD
jgi:uncharacterized protein YneF (UPF0154 family)